MNQYCLSVLEDFRVNVANEARLTDVDVNSKAPAVVDEVLYDDDVVVQGVDLALDPVLSLHKWPNGFKLVPLGLNVGFTLEKKKSGINNL